MIAERHFEFATLVEFANKKPQPKQSYKERPIVIPERDFPFETLQSFAVANEELIVGNIIKHRISKVSEGIRKCEMPLLINGSTDVQKILNSIAVYVEVDDGKTVEVEVRENGIGIEVYVKVLEDLPETDLVEVDIKNATVVPELRALMCKDNAESIEGSEEIKVLDKQNEVTKDKHEEAELIKDKHIVQHNKETATVKECIPKCEEKKVDKIKVQNEAALKNSRSTHKKVDEQKFEAKKVEKINENNKAALKNSRSTHKKVDKQKSEEKKVDKINKNNSTAFKNSKSDHKKLDEQKFEGKKVDKIIEHNKAALNSESNEGNKVELNIDPKNISTTESREVAEKSEVLEDKDSFVVEQTIFRKAEPSEWKTQKKNSNYWKRKAKEVNIKKTK